jgi:iron complex transport system substrate-binding protein
MLFEWTLSTLAARHVTKKKAAEHGLFLLACAFALQASAAISVRDDTGTMVTLQQPARRVVSLAPHVTELLFAAGGAERIVGTVSYSDYPPAARAIPRIGDNQEVDIERLLALKPDLLVVWRHNASTRQLEQLRELGIPLFYSEPHKLADIPDTLQRLGQLLGTEPQAQREAEQLRRQLSDLAARYRNRPPVRVFYQVWDRPLYTLNGRHIVSDAIRLCGGENIFASLPVIAPRIDIEAVLQKNPEAIVSGSRPERSDDGLGIWKSYPTLQAVRLGNLFAINGDLLNRPGPRMIAGAAALCETLEQARQRRGEKK